MFYFFLNYESQRPRTQDWFSRIITEQIKKKKSVDFSLLQRKKKIRNFEHRNHNVDAYPETGRYSDKGHPSLTKLRFTKFKN